MPPVKYGGNENSQERGHHDRQNRGSTILRATALRMSYAASVRHTQNRWQSLMTSTKREIRCRARWRLCGSEPSASRRTGGLSRERIVTAAIELADSRRPWRTVDGPPRRATGLRHDVALPARRQQGRVGDLHALDGARAAARANRSHGLAWRPDDWAAGLWDIYHRHPWVLRPPRPARPRTPASWPGSMPDWPH